VTWAAGLLSGSIGELLLEFAENLWTISFVFAALMALIVKSILSAVKADHVLDNGSLTRISGTSVDLTVASAVGAISLVIVGQYWIPIAIIAVIAGAFVVFAVPWMGSRLFANYRLHRTLILFGAMTGTLPTGLALLRVVDPDFETPVGTDYAYSSAIVFVILIPLILLMDQPAKSVAENNPGLVWITFGALAVYVIVGFVLYIVYAGRRSFRRPGKWWLPAGGEE
jgi:ESS family glutamate:Na+ symporter